VFANSIGIAPPNVTRDLVSLSKSKCDVLINCIGIGDPGKLMSAIGDFFTVTERFDTFAIDYLLSNPKTLYINFSSGAAYCSDFNTPVDDATTSKIMINSIKPEHYYGITKLYGEIKHRALKELNIVDLRIFGYFSRFIDLRSKYLITDVINAINKREILQTSSIDIYRDYIHPSDLFQAIQMIISKGHRNESYDIVSKSPISKFKLFEFFEKQYGLQYQIVKTAGVQATGTKYYYYSVSNKLKKLGWKPNYTSAQVIKEESRELLCRKSPRLLSRDG
jgi:nucleoside-diphosphate-sugar epimerase